VFEHVGRELQPLVWAKKWADWLFFLFEAREHGGIDVG